MTRSIRKFPNNWVIAVESTTEKHHAIIHSTVAKRAYQLFEQRGCRCGFDFDDWIAAEKQVLADDFSGDTSAYRFVIECPGDPEVTTILSLSTHSLVVYRSYAPESENGREVVSVHVMAQEVDPATATVKSVNELLHVHVSKKSGAG